MRFTIWGEVGAQGSNGPVALGGRLRLLLAALLAGRNSEVGRNDLITIVWGEESEPANAEASLRQYVSRLRKALSEAEGRADALISTTPSGYRLDVDRSAVDADVIADAVAAGVQPPGLDALTSGTPYGSYGDEWWCLSEVEHQQALVDEARDLPAEPIVRLPTGTVTFLFTDIERSTQQWETAAGEMASAVERHDEILHAAIERYNGHVFSTTGDGFAAVFHRAADAVEAAIDAQRTLQAERWPSPVSVKVRMGLHTGEATERGGDYCGPAVNRAARLMETAHSGQILVSSGTSALIDSYELQPLGEHWLKDIKASDRVSQVVAEGLVTKFAPIRSLHSIPNNLPTSKG
ncbi:MAG: adenylate/guanylate cyclase domain-containing protein, partial [Acidimicrobiales bacterium]